MIRDPDENDDTTDFEWVDEDENEVPESRGKPLSSMNSVAAWIMGGLAGLFILYMIMRLMLALADYFE
jgi:hypothetical protein